MASILAVLIVLLTFFEHIQFLHLRAEEIDIQNIPLTKSLAIPTNFANGPKQDDSLDRNFIELYREMVAISKTVEDALGSEEEKRLKRIVGEDNLILIKEGSLTRRRGLSRTQQRRQQNKDLRREKLNDQGLRNHLQHVKQTSPAPGRYRR